MASSIKQAILVLSILVFSCRTYGLKQVPCYFIFGDSLADNGNNNVLATRAKANYPPYGIDFPDGPTGRFTNGRTMFDVIAELLGFRTRIPPFATARGTDILKGVNYASGASGIRFETGRHLGMDISMNEQLWNHHVTVARIIWLLRGKKAAADLLNNCLYTVDMGSNDFINNYFMPRYYSSSRMYTLEQFVQILIDEYYQQLRTLYTSGARKVAVFGLGSIGCTPDAISKYGTNGSLCVDSLNNAASLFNQKLRPMVDRLNTDLPNAKFTLVSPEVSRDALVQLGLRIFDKGCCPLSDIGQCIEFSTPCPNRLDHLFWDGFHPTEVVNVALGNLAYAAIVTSYLSPI